MTLNGWVQILLFLVLILAVTKAAGHIYGSGFQSRTHVP
jgi:hypothetical protein